MPRTPKPTDHLDSFRHLMGTQPDHEIAKLCDSTPSIVGRYRRKHNIPAYEGYKFGMGQEPPSKKTADEDEANAADAAATEAAAPVAAAAEPTKARSGGRSKLDAHRDIIGVLSDAEVAGRAGVTPEAVRVYRQRHDIPSRRSAAAAAAAAPPVAALSADDDKKSAQRRASKLDQYMDLVGTLPDREVATMAGVTPENVRAFRRRHDIPARWRDEGDEPEAPVAAPAPVVEAPVVEAPVVKAAPVKAPKAPKAPKAARTVEAPAPVAEVPAAVVAAPEPVVAAPAPVVAAPAPVVVAPPAPAPRPAPVAVAAPRTLALNGYMVHVRAGGNTSEYLIVASDIASAAANAVAAVDARIADAEIIAIRHLGPALA